MAISNDVSRLYREDKESVKIYEIPIVDKNVEDFIKGVKTLRHSVGENYQNEHYSPYFKLFYRVRRYLTATFLPLDEKHIFHELQQEKMRENLSWLNQICCWGKQFSELFESSVKFCKEETEFQHIKCLKNYLNIANSSCKNNCYFPAPKLTKLREIEKLYSEALPSLKYCSSGMMRTEFQQYDIFFAAGPRSWYCELDFLFDGSRIKQLYFIYYSFLSRGVVPQLINGTLSKISRPVKVELNTIDMNPCSLKDEEDSDNGSYVSETDVFTIASNHVDDGGQSEHVSVVARRYDLAEGHIVYLPEDDEARVRILDNTSGEWETPSIRVSRLKKGMYLLLLTAGDGDYVKATAEKEHKEYRGYRDRLLAWKKELQQKISDEGLENIVSELILNGSEIATEINVRNWASCLTIKPRKERDFAAIVRLIGKTEAEEKELWFEARKLVNWHHLAGRKVMKQLRNSAAKNIAEKEEQLSKYGHVRLELETGISIDVFEILNIAEESGEAGYAPLYRPVLCD